MNKKKELNEFYHKIDELCIEKRITHRKVAEEIGVDEVTLSRYLTGERRITLFAFMGMCKVFGVPAEELYKTYLCANMETRVAKYREEHEKWEVEN